MSRSSLLSRIPGFALAGAAVVLLAVAFTSTAITTAWTRIAALRTVETYAFAVHEQLMATFASTGTFAQTIHRGYDDAWTWSGHRAPMLVINALLYRLWPSALGLASRQILAVVAGVVPAAALGRAALRSRWGLWMGAAIYLGAPAVMALALQDYQDLVFALPALLFAFWGFRARRASLAVVGALAGCLPREECLALVVAAAVVSLGAGGKRPWRRWLRNVGIAGGVAGGVALLYALVFPVSAGAHDMPLLEGLKALSGAHGRVRLHGLPYLHHFYALAWAPLGLLALLSPLTAAPGGVLIVLHMTVPFNHGVDRYWGHHVHHMAPVMPFLLVATIEGAGRALRWLAKVPRMPWLPVPAAVAAVLYGAWWDARWVRWFNLDLALLPRSPDAWHPAWELAERIPPDGIPLVSKRASLTVSSRLEAYTWGQSLLDKRPEAGLAAGTHLVVHRDHEDVVPWALAMPGAEVVAEAGDHLLIAWEPTDRDPTLESWDSPPRRILDHPDPAPHTDLPPGWIPPDPHPVSGIPIRAGKIDSPGR